MKTTWAVCREKLPEKPIGRDTTATTETQAAQALKNINCLRVVGG